nr:hypothetical protein [Tanacetum cinerariifolium]
LRGEIYFVKFIIYPEEDDVQPGVIFERSFLRMTKAITDFGAGTITIYLYINSFLEDIEEEEKILSLAEPVATSSLGASEESPNSMTSNKSGFGMAHAHDCVRNRSDIDTMSLDDLYNHLKVYEPEVQKKSESNSQNMAFISLVKNISGNEEVGTASIPTASTHVSPASANIGAISIRVDRKTTGKVQRQKNRLQRL